MLLEFGDGTLKVQEVATGTTRMRRQHCEVNQIMKTCHPKRAFNGQEGSLPGLDQYNFDLMRAVLIKQSMNSRNVSKKWPRAHKKT